jgi:hypothetical protein
MYPSRRRCSSHTNTRQYSLATYTRTCTPRGAGALQVRAPAVGGGDGLLRRAQGALCARACARVSIHACVLTWRACAAPPRTGILVYLRVARTCATPGAWSTHTEELKAPGRSARTGVAGQECQDRSARTGVPGQEWQDRSGRTGVPGQECQDRSARTGVAGQECQDRSVQAPGQE